MALLQILRKKLQYTSCLEIQRGNMVGLEEFDIREEGEVTSGDIC